MHPLIQALTNPEAFFPLTYGAGAVVYGFLRPLTFLVIALVAWKSPRAGGGMRWLMVAGALGNALTSLVFIFVAGEEAPPDWLVDTAELVAVPSQVLFTIGFTAAAIRLAGLKFGNHH